MRTLRPSGRRPLLGLIPLLVIFVFTATGCTKMTGGGWIPSLAPGEKATFGFTAKCKTATINGLPAAVLHEGQFEYTDHGVDISVHGAVLPREFQTVFGMTCKELANADPNVLKIGGFEGKFWTQPKVGPLEEGEFSVVVFDGGKPGQTVIDGDQICVDLFGPVTYFNCGDVQGGNIRVE